MYLLFTFMFLAVTVLVFSGPASADTTVPLSSLNQGDTVTFAGYKWIVLDPANGYLLMQGFYPGGESYNRKFFDTDATNTFDPTDLDNIAFYLNSIPFYNSLPSADQGLIQSHSWGIGNENDESLSAVTCKVGLLSYSEWKNYSTNYNTSTGFLGNPSSPFWLRTPSSDASSYVWGVTLLGGLTDNYANFPLSVRPALYLNPGISVSGGNGGTVADGVYYNVGVSASPAAGGSVTGGGVCAYASQVTVTAAAKRGYEFHDWTDSNGTEVSTAPSYTFTMGAADTTLTANFQSTPTPAVTVVNGEPFSVTIYNTYGTLTGTNSTYGITGTASGNDTVISGTPTNVPGTPTAITLGSGTIEIKAVNPPSTTLDNSKSFY